MASDDKPRAKLLRTGDVVRVTGLDPRVVRSEADAGELPTVNIGKYRRFAPAAVDQYCRRLGITSDK
jgi:hypothetical protein